MPKGPLHGLCAALFLSGRMHQVVWGRTGWYHTGKPTRPTGAKAMAGIQSERPVELYRRDGAGWTVDMVRDGPVMLAALDLTIPLEAVYEDQ